MHVLLNENGYVESYALIGTLVDGIEVPDPEDIDHFEDHYEAYGFVDGRVIFNDAWQTMLAKEKAIDEIRERREKECFTIVNRGQLWYEKLSKKKKEELEIWYQAWLYATNTGVIPDKPGWL